MENKTNHSRKNPSIQKKKIMRRKKPKEIALDIDRGSTGTLHKLSSGTFIKQPPFLRLTSVIDFPLYNNNSFVLNLLRRYYNNRQK